MNYTVRAGREPESTILEEMVAEAPAAINFTMFLGLFGDRLKGTVAGRWNHFPASITMLLFTGNFTLSQCSTLVRTLL